jgi:hypothetical protein
LRKNATALLESSQILIAKGIRNLRLVLLRPVVVGNSRDLASAMMLRTVKRKPGASRRRKLIFRQQQSNHDNRKLKAG